MVQEIKKLKKEIKTIEQLKEELQTLLFQQNKDHWAIAEKISEIETYYGEQTMAGVAKELMMSKSIAYAYREIFSLMRKFETIASAQEIQQLKDYLPFWHWKQVLVLEVEEAYQALKTALEEKWTQEKLRQYVSLGKASEEIESFANQILLLSQESLAQLKDYLRGIIQILSEAHAFPKVLKYLISFLEEIEKVEENA